MIVEDLRAALKDPPMEWELRQRQIVFLARARDAVVGFVTAPLFHRMSQHCRLYGEHRQCPGETTLAATCLCHCHLAVSR